MFAPPVAKLKSAAPERAPIAAQIPVQTAAPYGQRLQRTIGNQATIRLMMQRANATRDEPDRIQAKLRVGAVDDRLEHEADQVADEVTRMPAPASGVATANVSGRGVDIVRPVTLQRNASVARADAGAAPASVHQVLRSPGQPLDAATRAYFEPRFGQDFSGVRVHTGTSAEQSAQDVGARAYTVGQHVAFGAGQYEPATATGRQLIAHELTHVISGARKQAIYRKPKSAPPLDISVPDPDTFAPEFKYPWQNPNLRETIYPYRDEELAFFLRTYMEIDLDNPSTPVTPVTGKELIAERGALDAELKEVTAKIKEAKKANEKENVTELSARAHRLEADLKYLPAPPKTGGAPKGADKKWTAYLYSKKNISTGEELDHDALLERIIDRFDADPTYKRYPKWIRYMVFHFSGMRYGTAHYSYAPPIDLLNRLKRDELSSRLKSAPKSEIAGHASDAINELKAELDATNRPKKSRTEVIKSRLTALHAVEKERETAFSKKDETAKRTAFERLTELEDERDRLKASLGSTRSASEVAEVKGKLQEIEPQIKAREAEIDSKLLGQVRNRLDVAENRRRDAVIAHEIERAEKEFSKLDDMQALSIIKAMQARIPEWVWREIVRLTPLKLEVEKDGDWETVTAGEKAAMKRTDPATERWKQIMGGWRKDIDAWSTKHGSDLSLVVIRAVCNQISEMALHARGIESKPGVGAKVRWYATGGRGTTFSRPTKESELKPGASLFFLIWSSIPPIDDPAKFVKNSLGVALKSENDEVISDGFKGQKEWIYYFSGDKTVTRTRAVQIGTSADPAKPPPMMTQTEYLIWRHEAQVIEVDSKRGRLLTFETGPIGLRTRNIEAVLNRWDVFVGFAPSSKEPAGIDEYLKDILPGR